MCNHIIRPPDHGCRLPGPDVFFIFWMSLYFCSIFHTYMHVCTVFTSSPPCHQCKREVEWLCMSKMILGHHHAITLTWSIVLENMIIYCHLLTDFVSCLGEAIKHTAERKMLKKNSSLVRVHIGIQVCQVVTKVDKNLHMCKSNYRQALLATFKRRSILQ